MFGMADLLRLYKSCSEFMQLVNDFPWEKVEACDSFQGLIAALAEELGDGTMDDVCFKFCAKEGRSVFLEGALKGHTLSLGDNDGVLEGARADVLEYLQEWCHGFHACLFYTPACYKRYFQGVPVDARRPRFARVDASTSNRRGRACTTEGPEAAVDLGTQKREGGFARRVFGE
jgi:hypothetical protein